MKNTCRWLTKKYLSNFGTSYRFLWTYSQRLRLKAGFNKELLIVTGVLGFFTLIRTIAIVPAGHVGIRDLFGKVDNNTYNAGLHFINPFAKMHRVSTKTQNLTVNVEVPSKEGLNIKLLVSALYRINPEKATEIYTTIGLNYRDVILQPQLGSMIRQVTSNYEAKDLYTSSARLLMHQDLTTQLSELLLHRGIIIEDTPLREITLPEKLTQAIEEKLKAEQESQRMQFILQREQLEAERKAIEAGGIANFQKIVTEGISDQLLHWKGIEATEGLSKSANTKVIIIGGKDGLPIIFNSSPDKIK